VKRLRFTSAAVCFASLRSADISKGRAKVASFITMSAFGDVYEDIRSRVRISAR